MKQYISTIRVYKEIGDMIDRSTYFVKNAESVANMGISSGDTINIKNIGKLTVYNAEVRTVSGNIIRTLITCGLRITL